MSGSELKGHGQDEAPNRPLLETLELPGDLASLEDEDLRRLAYELRQEIIRTISRTGGHLGPSLGVVELTLALHSELSSPRDRIIWDVGHQCYAHKLLTGRRHHFSGIRTMEGISGFPRRAESPHDIYGTGHSSTSISAGTGIAEALRLLESQGKGEDASVVAVIGDGALTGGMAFEGLNYAGDVKTPLVVVLNDNEMSIKRNVGAMSSYLSRLRTTPTLYRLRRDMERRLQRFPGIGEVVASMGEQLKEGVKAAIVPGMLFEELGFTYIGVTDGHDVAALRRDIRHALALRGPVVVHMKTIKGKGYLPAEEQPARFHGISPFDVRTGRSLGGTAKAVSYTEAFGRALVSLAREDERIVGITAAMGPGTGLDLLEEAFPKRFYDVGIAEAHAAVMAAGMAATGLRPVVALYSTFMQRAYDQLIHDVCLQNLPVVFALDRAGLVGDDGPTHHGAFDLSYLRAVPNLTVLVPKDEAELQRLLATALVLEGPVALRYPRGRGRGVPLPQEITPLSGPWAEVLAEGDEVLLLGTGTGVPLAERAAELLSEEGVAATVVNVRKVAPLPVEELRTLLADHPAVVTVEENVLAGGFGSSVLEMVADERLDIAVDRVGLPNRFVGHGPTAVLHEQVGFTASAVRDKALRLLGERRGLGGRVRER